MIRLLSLVTSIVLLAPSLAAEPFLKPGDVIAFVGGEEMVAAAEYGYLELLLTRALPEHNLRFRSMAWEGDTVFEQRRDLNYPTLEQQLDHVGATVVLAQFGQMESLAGKEKLPEFVAAASSLLARLGGSRSPSNAIRRIALLAPSQFGQSDALIPELTSRTADQKRLALDRQESLVAYSDALRALVGTPGQNPHGEVSRFRFLETGRIAPEDLLVQRDGVHLNDQGHWYAAGRVAGWLGVQSKPLINSPDWSNGTTPAARHETALLALIREKNRLWFHYYRPQNWAFLAGDRTNQPSSRDHLDREKRWFPAELEQFLPLIEKKEAEIAELAARPIKP